MYMHCRLDIDVQLVTSHVGGFDDVRVRASLFQLDEAHPNGCSEVLPAVEVEVKDKNHWISLDTSTKRSHAEAGTGGLALVRLTACRSHSTQTSKTHQTPMCNLHNVCSHSWQHLHSVGNIRSVLRSQIEIDMAASAHLPALWSAEEPNLYVLVLSVVRTGGEHLDSESVQVNLQPCKVPEVYAFLKLYVGRYVGVGFNQTICYRWASEKL